MNWHCQGWEGHVKNADSLLPGKWGVASLHPVSGSSLYTRSGKVKVNLKLKNYNLKGKNMKGEILERAKHIVLNIVKYIIKIAWEVIIIDELAMKIIWEALNLFGLYITLRIVKHMLPIAEYLPLEVKTSFIKLIEEKVGQEMKF